MKILLAVPTFESIEPATFKSIYELNKCGHDIAFVSVTGYDCAKARNEIVKKALNDYCDYILMVDSDIILPQNALQHLIDPLVDICLGVYPRKLTVTGQTELFKLGHTDFNNINNITINDIQSCGVDRLEIKGGGMGCALIKTDVFKKIVFPWFTYVTYPNGAVLSEDLDFCCKAIANGFHIYADTRVRCGHINKIVKYS